MLLDLMDKSLVYRKTGRGTTELAATHGGALSPAARRVLILLDGQRTLAELADLFGADLVEHIVSELEANGFARMVDPDDPGLTTQSVPSANYPPNLAHILPPLPPESKPRLRALGGVALVLVAAASAGGYWFAARPERKADQIVAAAGQSDAAPVAVTLASDEQTGSTPPDTIRELPLSGLPAITVTPPRPVAPPSAATEPAPQGRHPVERPVPAPATEASSTPEAAQPSNAGSAAPSDAGSPAPVRPPAPSPRPVVVAAAETVPPPRPTPEAPASPAPSPANVAPPAPAAPLSAAAPPASAGPASALRAPAGESANPPAEQVAALAPAAPPRSGPVELHPRRHEAPAFPGRALRAKILQGQVLARIWVNAEGAVEQVDIVKADPPRIFDDEVKRALSGWTFDPPGRPVDTTIELMFKP
jgi:protein TonB